MGTNAKPNDMNCEQPEALGLQLTKQFLEFSLEKEIESFSVKLGTSPGDNYMSVMHGVDVLFKGETKWSHYLIKSYPNHPGRRQLLDKLNLFKTEYFIYNDFFPQLKQIAMDNGVESKLKLPVPPFHGGNIVGAQLEKFKTTTWSTENFIIMTDIRTSNYTMVDRIKGLDLEHATIVIKEMTKLHALTWAYKQENGLDFLASKFPALIDRLYSEPMDDQIKPMVEPTTRNALKVIENRLGDKHPACVNLRKIVDSGIMEFMRKFMQPQGKGEDEYEEMLRVKPAEDGTYSKEPWLTGTHGDCWVNNLLFRYDPDDEGHPKPVDVIFVDFQMFREACPTVDIAYLLFTSIREPIRTANKNKLLEIYHDSFVMYCAQLKVTPYPGFSLDSLKRRFRRSEIYGFLVSLPLMSVWFNHSDQSGDMDKSEAKDAVELYSKLVEGSEKNTKLNEEIIATVLYLYGNGVL